ncbi:hypothetical protein ACFSCV_14310 [Methylopila henanensis]|uniref:Uncharacterized protein n=1 Tax=Methylopila henanensis TaxID=873516 RepID=A0ABW4K7N5_9HYPH
MARPVVTSWTAAAAFVAVMGAIALLTLSAGAQHAAAGKGDRLASPAVSTAPAVTSSAATTGEGFVTNVSSRTTTVAKGAATPIDPSSPYARDTK